MPTPAPPRWRGMSGWKQRLALTAGGLGVVTITAGVVLATRHPGTSASKRQASGFSWISVPSLASTGSFRSASCPGATMCYVVGGGAAGFIASTTNGRAWSTTAVPQVQQLTAVACPSPSRCWAGGETRAGSAVIVATTDGRTWNTQTATPDAVITSIACPSSAVCLAVGTDFSRQDLSDVFATIDGGATWRPRPLPAGDAHPLAVSCWDSTRCMEVGGGGTWTTSNVGATWQGRPTPGPPATGGFGYVLDSVTYISATDVWTVGGSQCGGVTATQCDGWAFHSTDGGATWTPYAQADRKFPFAQQVVCDGPHCLVLAQAFKSSSVEDTQGGASWRTTATANAQLDTLACSSRNYLCVAGGSIGTSPALFRTAS
ncbi:MAG TPA: hypothetical protein VIG86_07740 [Candidatus Dormibacteraeota bacterium]